MTHNILSAMNFIDSVRWDVLSFLIPIGFCALFYVFKFFWQFVLRKPRNPFYDERPLRWYLLIALFLAFIAALIYQAPASAADEVPQMVMLVLAYAWGWIFVLGKEQLEAFR